MAINPTNNTVTLTAIQNEFGGTEPTSLNEYYRGGAYVPDTPTNRTCGKRRKSDGTFVETGTGIPKSGKIEFDDFFGSSVLVPLEVRITGSGGTGGQGFQDGAGTGRAGSGAKCGLITEATYNAKVQSGSYNNDSDWAASDFILGQNTVSGANQRMYANGGLGGSNGNQGDTGTDGKASYYGTGGAGGASWKAGDDAPFNYGAGGGGGGGDPSGGSDTGASMPYPSSGADGGRLEIDVARGYYGGGGPPPDEAGKGGSGGEAGQTITFKVELAPGTYYAVLGKVGSRATVGNFNGGLGAKGTLAITTELESGQNTQIVPAPISAINSRLLTNLVKITIKGNGSVVIG